jgi:hypothetical protein
MQFKVLILAALSLASTSLAIPLEEVEAEPGYLALNYTVIEAQSCSPLKCLKEIAGTVCIIAAIDSDSLPALVKCAGGAAKDVSYGLAYLRVPTGVRVRQI